MFCIAYHTCLCSRTLSTFCLPKCVTTAPRLFKIRELFINHCAALKQQESIASVRLLSSQQVTAERMFESVQEYSEMKDEKAHPTARVCVCVSCYRKRGERRPTLCSHPVPVDKQLTSALNKTQHSFSICCVLLTLPVPKPMQSLTYTEMKLTLHIIYI